MTSLSPKLRGPITGVLVVAVILFAFSGTVMAGGYVIGTLTPNSGAAASFGEPLYKAGELAAHYVNEAGGIRGHEIVLKNEDTATSEISGVRAARDLVNKEEVSAIVGAYSSGVAMAAAESVIIPGEITFVTPGTSPIISVLDDSDYVFRSSAHDLQSGRVLGDAIAEDGHDRIGIIYVNNVYGLGLAKSTAAAFERFHGGEVLASIPFEIDQESYASEVELVYDDGNIDAAVIIAYPEDAKILHRDIMEAGWSDIPWYGSPDQKVRELVEELGAEYMSGLEIGITQGRWDSPSRESFQEGFDEFHGEKPSSPYMAPMFDGISSVALAIAASGRSPEEITGTDIRDHMREVTSPPGKEIYATVEDFKKAFELLDEGEKVNYMGVVGPVEFDAYGDSLSAVKLWSVDGDGEFVTVENRLGESIPREMLPPEFQK